ncbi:MAG: HAD family hydrolase [Thermodesulfobacteriota bacterium]
MFQGKAIFLDRDGVINEKLPGDEYVGSADQFRLLPGVVDALKIFRRLGFMLAVVTNQRGVALQKITEEDVNRVHEHMNELLRSQGIRIDRITHCPHDNNDPQCRCRKPKPGLILRTARTLGLNLHESYMVGDSVSDIEAGRNAGIGVTVFIGAENVPRADLCFPGLLGFAQYLLRMQGAKKGSE